MDSRGQETLHRVLQNDDTLKSLQIGGRGGFSPRRFHSSDGDDYSTLGTCIKENTHLTKLVVVLVDVGALDVTNHEFYEGIKQNSSIHILGIDLNNQVIEEGGVVEEILETYQEKNNLTELSIHFADLQNGGENVIATTVRNSTNIKHIDIYGCNITDGQLMPMIDAIRGLSSLEILYLFRNGIGNVWCSTFATLLRDPNCNIHSLDLRMNRIYNEGGISLANSLINNTKLKYLYLDGNAIDQGTWEAFARILCNKSSINSIYSSNHTLERVLISGPSGDELDSLLNLNKCTDKSLVAIKKILKYHPNIDMEPLFEWNMEGEGEHDLKALPYVISWFDRAGEAVADDGGSYNIDAKKLSAIYQFAKAMPLLFVPVPHGKGGDHKRKRNDAYMNALRCLSSCFLFFGRV